MTRGGKRPNSGPKSSMSPYGEKTSVIRVPTSIKSDVLVYLEAYKKKTKVAGAEPDMLQALPNPPALARPIYSGKVTAGQSRFPSPAQDYEQKFLDLNDRYVTNPTSTFFFQVKGDSMTGAGIYEGAVLIEMCIRDSPNIDINIKCGNSLISRFGLDSDLKQALKKSRSSIKNYKSAVDTYRNASNLSLIHI